ncbi:MAG: A/G-specific adenine glycosylase [Gemmatimonadales bacterium]
MGTKANSVQVAPLGEQYLQLHARAFRRSLLRWFGRNGRDLPWRRTRNPYHIMVSEFMLQQTQVVRVEGYYHRFLARYPTLEDLASAPPAMVRESWEGLGYYRRAVNLHRLAQEVVQNRGGIIPSDTEELRRLPGIGRYTAAAVASFAFEREVTPIDTNVGRVLRRVFHSRARSRALPRRLERSAEMLLPRGGKKAWMFNQAIMELGALVCTARVPHCEICPVRAICQTAVREAGRTTSASRRQKAQPGRGSPQSRRRSAGGLAVRRSSGLLHR